MAGWYIKAAQHLRGDSAAVANAKRKAFFDAQFAQATTVSLLEDVEDIASDSAAACTAQGREQALTAALDLFELEQIQEEAARSNIRVAFVSTNSITQGEQVGVLWSWMLKEGMRIEFAHRTFSWSNEASGQATVHYVIIGFGLSARVDALPTERLFDYDEPKGTPLVAQVSRINPYLTDAADIALPTRKQPLFNAPPIVFGSMPNDGGHLLFSEEEYRDFLNLEPEAAPWLRPFLGAEEFINTAPRYCLWLVDISPQELAALPLVKKRIAAVKQHRLHSSREATKRLATSPHLFGEVR